MVAAQPISVAVASGSATTWSSGQPTASSVAPSLVAYQLRISTFTRCDTAELTPTCDIADLRGHVGLAAPS
jgi:hypothetical protein